MKTLILLTLVIFILAYLLDYRFPKPQTEAKAERKERLLRQIEHEKSKILDQSHSQALSPELPSELSVDANVKSVYYGQTNLLDTELVFDKYELCDSAVVIELMNGKLICWKWVEQGAYGPEFSVSYGEVNPMWEDGFVVFRELTASQNWQSLITQRLLSLELKKTTFSSGEIYLSNLILHFSDSELTICGINEPGLEGANSIKDFGFAPDWTAIVFDKDMLKGADQHVLS